MPINRRYTVMTIFPLAWCSSMWVTASAGLAQWVRLVDDHFDVAGFEECGQGIQVPSVHHPVLDEP